MSNVVYIVKNKTIKDHLCHIEAFIELSPQFVSFPIRLTPVPPSTGTEDVYTLESLLEALESTKLNLLLDVGFNREVGEDGALYWKKEQLASVIDQAEQLDEQAIEDLNQKSSKRIAEAFTWEKIVTDYEKVFKG